MTKEHIDNSIQLALAGKSNLSESELSVRGFSTRTMRRLFNNLCNLKDKTYLEVGLYCGATFCSSFNSELVSIGIEDFSQDFGVGTVKGELLKNVKEFSAKSKNYHIFDSDCFAIDKLEYPNPIDIYFFDGNHAEEFQAKALPHFFESMANKFLFIVDDFNWASVFNGTNKGFDSLSGKIEVEYYRVLRGYQLQDDPIWHNGVCIYLINKK